MTPTAYITGANRGLGKGFVEHLVSQGYQVFAGVRTLPVDDPLFEDAQVTPIVIDLLDDVSIQHAAAEVTKQTDHIDLLVNNAGSNKKSATNGKSELVCALDALDRDKLLKMFSANAVGPMMVVQAFLPLLKNDPSFVINVSSDRASFHDEIPNSSANYGYRASKVALNMFTFCSVMDLPNHVKTFAVHPGSVLTDMNPEGDSTPLQQAEQIISITKNWRDELNGLFLRPSGELYPL